VIFCARDQLLGRCFVTRRVDRVERLMGSRDMVQPPPVARCVLHDRRQERGQLGRVFRHIADLGQPQERAAAVLHTVDGIFRVEAFAAGDAGQLASLALNQTPQIVERIVEPALLLRQFGLRQFGVHRASRC
jgi:hypothetical protein